MHLTICRIAWMAVKKKTAAYATMKAAFSSFQPTQYRCVIAFQINWTVVVAGKSSRVSWITSNNKLHRTITKDNRDQENALEVPNILANLHFTFHNISLQCIEADPNHKV